MNVRATIIMWIVAAILIGAAVIVIGADPSAGGDGRQRPLITADGFAFDDVATITVRRPGEHELTFQKSNRGWQQVQPFPYPMDAFSITQFIEQARQLEVVDEIDSATLGEQLTLAALGLEPPATSILYEAPRGTLELLLGRRGIAGRAYIRIAGDPAVYVVGQALHERAAMDPKEWRDRRIFQHASVESSRVERRLDESRLIIERVNRQWKMSEPVATRLDPVARDEFLQALGSAVCEGFIRDQPDDLARFGLSNPIGTIEVHTVRGGVRGDAASGEVQTERLLLGAPISATTNDRYAMVEGVPVVFRLSAAVIAAFFVEANRLVDVTASGVRPGDVKSMRVVGPGGEFRVQRDLERWVDAERPAREVPADRVEELLHQVTELRSPYPAQFAAFPRELEIGRVDLYGYDGLPITSIRIAFDESSGTWLMDNGEHVQRLFTGAFRMLLSPGDYGLGDATP